MDALPRTFQDVIVLCCEIGIRYLWIDSLYIVQNSKEDWDTESARMPSVYANAYLTVAAGSTKDSRQGLHTIRQSSSAIPAVKLEVSVNTTEVAIWIEKSRGQNSYSYLDRRAWCLQEQMLSNRLLSYEPVQISWTCRERTCSELVPIISEAIEIAEMPFKQMFKQFMHRLAEHGTLEQDFYQLWFKLVADYTKRELTYISDKLVALSGVAQLLLKASNSVTRIDGSGEGHKFPDVYLAGVWQRSLPAGLLWEVQHPNTNTNMSRGSSKVDHTNPHYILAAQRRLPELNFGAAVKKALSQPKTPAGAYRAPTWSWASQNGHISLENCWEQTRVNPVNLKMEKVFSVIEATTIPKGMNPCGALNSGHLRVRAAAREITYNPSIPYPSAPQSWPPTELISLDGNKSPETSGRCNFDVAEPERGDNIWLMQCTDRRDLILRSRGKGSDDFVRIGVFEHEYKQESYRYFEMDGTAWKGQSTYPRHRFVGYEREIVLV
jgi:hypothetical protein